MQPEPLNDAVSCWCPSCSTWVPIGDHELDEYLQSWYHDDYCGPIDRAAPARPPQTAWPSPPQIRDAFTRSGLAAALAVSLLVGLLVAFAVTGFPIR